MPGDGSLDCLVWNARWLDRARSRLLRGTIADPQFICTHKGIPDRYDVAWPSLEGLERSRDCFMHDSEDRHLVQAILGGDTAAFEGLVSRYQKTLFNAAYRITSSPDDALEATQAALVKAYDKLASYKPEHRLVASVPVVYE